MSVLIPHNTNDTSLFFLNYFLIAWSYQLAGLYFSYLSSTLSPLSIILQCLRCVWVTDLYLIALLTAMSSIKITRNRAGYFWNSSGFVVPLEDFWKNMENYWHNVTSHQIPAESGLFIDPKLPFCIFWPPGELAKGEPVGLGLATGPVMSA